MLGLRVPGGLKERQPHADGHGDDHARALDLGLLDRSADPLSALEHVPRFKPERGDIQSFFRLTLTERGERLVGNGGAHPLHPNFIARFRSAAPTATDTVVAHLEDAVACLVAHVLRSAVMMLSLATEETIRIARAALYFQGKGVKAPGGMANARDLIAAIEPVVRAWPGKEDQHRITMAVVAAESIRVERNSAAHPGKQVTDGPHVEQLLESTASHLPVLWERVIKPAVDQGFVLQASP